jgi:ferredoxin
MTRTRQDRDVRVTIDRIACDGRGICAELLPERIGLDEWGYPVLDPTPLTDAEQRHARRAVSQCPRLALALVSVMPTSG